MVQIICPFRIDYSAGATIFGYNMDQSTPTIDYLLDMYSYFLTPSMLSNAYQYMNDPESVLPLFRVINAFEAKVEDGVFYDFSNSITVMNTSGPKPYFDGSNVVPANGTFGQMIVQMVASCLFGHPGAQSMIRNEKVLIGTIACKNTIAKPFVNTLRGTNVADGEPLPNAMLQSLFEQLFAGAPERFSQYDDVLRNLPFEQSDVLVVDIRAVIYVSNNNPSTLNSPDYTANPINVNTMFNGRVGYDRDNGRLLPRTFRVRIHLIRDIISASDSRVPSMIYQTKPPQSDVSEKAWLYQKLSTDTLPNISWSLFKNTVTTNRAFSQLECCYVMVKVAAGSRIPWISLRTLPQADGQDASVNFRSQWNFKGHYNANYGSPSVTRDSKVLFYFGQTAPNLTFYNLMNNNLLVAYNVQTYNSSSTMGNVGPLNVAEIVSEVILQTDASASSGEYLMWVYEIGYKFAGQSPIITSFE